MKILKGLVWLLLSVTYGLAVVWLLAAILALAATFLFTLGLTAQTLFSLRVGLAIIFLVSLACTSHQSLEPIRETTPGPLPRE